MEHKTAHLQCNEAAQVYAINLRVYSFLIIFSVLTIEQEFSKNQNILGLTIFELMN